MPEIENEIEILESILGGLTDAMRDCLESPYHKYLADSLEIDIAEINNRLEELYDIQNDCWEEEMKHQKTEYERMVN